MLTVIYQKTAFCAIVLNEYNSDLLHQSFGKSVMGGGNIIGGGVQNITVIF